ncbi:MAG TPA: hypothetical protein PLZ36_15975, partial [Armatimonadota bacterium]|nr:hypothetical protein [Armatimonadota bacterium]
MRRSALFVRCLLLVCLGIWARAQAPAPAPAIVSLAEYGPIATPAQADAALENAAAALIAGGGGILLIPADAPAGWKPENITQGAWRKPDPPAPARQWGYTPGITIVDRRGGAVTVSVPQMTPLTIERTLRMAAGQSAGHWGYLPMLQLNNHLIRGAAGYQDRVVEGVQAGKARRIYVPTIRGLFPGMLVNAPGGKMSCLYIRSLGYDAERQLPYVVADVDDDIAAGTPLS